MTSIVIRFYEMSGGVLVDLTDEMEIGSLAGQVPMVGDYIVNSFMPVGSDRDDPANYTLFKIAARYFRPKSHDDYVAVVIERHKAGPEHIHLLR